MCKNLLAHEEGKAIIANEIKNTAVTFSLQKYSISTYNQTQEYPQEF